MDNPQFKVLISELNRELENLQNLVEENNKYLPFIEDPKNQKISQLRVFGSILHDFYTNIERSFIKIAKSMDRNLPKGGNWHIELLERMNLQIEKVRPRVINEELKEELYEYLRFRHVFRNVYGFTLKWEKMQPLVMGLERVNNRLVENIQEFVKFLKSL